MRVARPTLAVALLLAVGPLSPALASDGAARADTTQVVRGLNSLPSNESYGVLYRSCTRPGQSFGSSAGNIVIRKGPAPVPAGRRTWGFNPPNPGGAIGPFRALSSMGNLTTAQMQVFTENGGADGVGFADVYEDVNATKAWRGVTSSFHVAPDSWQTADVVARPYSWKEFGPGGATGQTFSGTIAAMVAHVGSDHGGLVGLGFGCTHPDFFHFDRAQFGSTGNVLTLDFEGPTTVTSIHGSTTTVVAGSPVQLRGVTTETGGTPLSSATLTLQARRFDSTRWRAVGSAVETFVYPTQHPALLKKRPLVKTDYRWVFAENATYDGSRSHAFTVRVHTAVTARPADTTVRQGGTIKVTGHVTPAKPGAVVTLFKGTRAVTTATVRRTGTYTLTTRAKTAGLWKLHVFIGAGSGNLAGTSKVVKVTVG